MPATTRSKTKQSRLEDFNVEDKGRAASPKSHHGKTNSQASAGRATKPASTRRKRENDEEIHHQHPEPPSKKTKQAKVINSNAISKPTASDVANSKPVVINRSPVLHLWAACVSATLHPSLSWKTHLAIGSTISALCAISKGRSIGTIEPSDADPDEKRDKEAKKRAAEQRADDEVEVMGFPVLLKGEDVVFQGGVKKGNEGLLKHQFGEEDYQRVRRAMDTALAPWKKDKNQQQLNKEAFHMYEDFRPTVSSGQKGWGRKGELRLDNIKQVVEKL